MKKFFIFIVLCLLSVQTKASIRSIADAGQTPEETQVDNERILESPFIEDEIPTDEEGLREYLRKRSEYFDISKLQKGDRIDNPSSFSRIDNVIPAEKKTYWEKIYDEAMERITQDVEAPAKLENIQYYSLSTSKNEEINQQEDIPTINISLPDGMQLKAPAIEHIPLISSQIEVLPNRMLKIYDKIIVVANNQKVTEGLVRFFLKRQRINSAKIQIIPNKVSINGTEIPYKLVEQKDYYMFKPQKSFHLTEGVYIFEFHYLVDHALWDFGDFYEFYWNTTGGHLNLPIARAIATVRFPGREPAVKRYVLTGQSTELDDKNAVMMNGKENVTGFMNISPLAPGEAMHVFMTVPKVDFLPVSGTQRIVLWIEEYGDIIFSAIYLLVVIISCSLSWRYIRHKLKFRNVNISSPLIARALWRGGADIKSVGGAFLDLFKKNIIDIQQQDEKLVLVRKSAHARGLSKFDQRLVKMLFSKKDSICKLNAKIVNEKLLPAVKKETSVQLTKLGLRLSLMYVCFNILLLFIVEAALCMWNPIAPLKGVFMFVDVLLLFVIGLYWFCFGKKWLKRLFYLILLDMVAFSGLVLWVYLHWIAVIMLMLGICIAFVFSYKASGQDALLKNAVESTRKLREFIDVHSEDIVMGRNFVLQQANIWVLDLEDKFKNNPKIKINYRLDEIKLIMM